MRFHSTAGVLGLTVALATTAAGAAPATSDTCGTCHRDIYRMWRSSSHAQALDNPFFLEPLGRLRDRVGTDRVKICIDCHAPLAGIVGDYELGTALAREGVSCEYCHAISHVDYDAGTVRVRAEVGDVKYGTIPHAESRAHRVAYSPLHERSIVCAPCHEHTAASGVSLMSTYSEWLGSSAAERGETCQSCHMALVESNVVDPRIARESGAHVNLHEMPGGHSLSQLNKALRLDVEPRRADGGVEVDVALENRGAGHAVPTGMPGRRIVLEVHLRTSDGESFDTSRIFEKSFVDGSGGRIDSVGGHFFADNLTLDSDTRLAADGRFDETFSFEVAPDATAWVTVRLVYEHAPWGSSAERESLTFMTHRRLVRR